MTTLNVDSLAVPVADAEAEADWGEGVHNDLKTLRDGLDAGGVTTGQPVVTYGPRWIKNTQVIGADTHVWKAFLDFRNQIYRVTYALNGTVTITQTITRNRLGQIIEVTEV